MTPAMIQLAITIGQLTLKYGPNFARGFQLIFTKENPTQEDWDKNVWNLAKEELIEMQS